MKNQKKQQFLRKGEERGITLIALVITIIVLLILAGISISMLTGENGILNQAAKAKDMTDISSIKERAELVKLGLQIDDWTKNNGGQLEKLALVSAIQKEFPGSTASGSVVTTDDRYDIRVDNDLNITVVKHQEVEAGEIAITYEQRPTESRAVVLRVYATVEGGKTYEEYATEYLEGKEDGPEMIQIFVDGFNYTMKDMTGGMAMTWQQIAGEDFSTVDEFYQVAMASSGQYTDYKDMMISYRFVDPQGYDEQYGATIVCNGETQTTGDYADFGITTNGEYDITATKGSGTTGSEIADVSQCEVETFSTICESNTTLEIDGYKVTVPAGFAYGTSENVGHVNTGFVITDSVDSNGNSTGNEFVWIPVKEDLTVGNTGKEMARLQDGSSVNYRGVLYIWNYDPTGNTEYPWSSTSPSYREPDVVSRYDGGEFDTVGITKSMLQNEYNAMIESIKQKQYGGFYVGRYEMGVENGKAISKINVVPTSAANEETSSWYGLYAKAKTYTNSKNSVTSSMIWGSQYDAMLNFALTGNDSAKINSYEYGNYSETLLKTGLTETQDSINNIYDLAGNLSEWTIEANSTSNRVYRGGAYDDSGSPSNRYNGNSDPNRTDHYVSSRLVLYVK